MPSCVDTAAPGSAAVSSAAVPGWLDMVHTDAIENFWRLLKRGIKGSQSTPRPGTCTATLPRTPFAYTNRETDDLGLMRLVTAGTSGRHLTWDELTS